MAKKLVSNSLYIIVASFAGGAVFADPIIDTRATVSIEGRYDDNATRVLNDSDADEITEQQNVYNLEFGGSQESSVSELEFDYRVFYEEYTKESQTSDTSATGKADLFFGNDSSIFGLSLRHSLQQVLATPQAEATRDNLFNRQEYAVAPQVRLRPSKVDTVLFTATGRKTDFESFNQSNTQDLSLDLEWDHKISGTTELGVIASHRDTEFEDAGDLDYSYRSVGGILRSELRLLSYELQAGINEIESDLTGETADDNYYVTEISYNGTVHTVQFNYESILTDTSDANSLTDPSNDATTGGSLEIQDQVASETFELSYKWDRFAQCVNCTLNLFATSQELDYVRFSEEDNTVIQYLASFNYRFSERSSLTLSYSERSVEFRNTPENDSDSSTYRIDYLWRFGKDTSVTAFYSGLEQTDEGLPENDPTSYDYNIVGLKLSYTIR